MSRTLRNRKRPDSVRMPAVPGFAKNPIIMARSVSAGPHSTLATHVPTNFSKSKNPPTASSTPTTPTSNKKQLEKIPSISAHSESSEEDEDADGGGGGGGNHETNNHNIKEDEEDDDDDDDDESDRDQIRKRTSVIKHQYRNTTDWSPCGGGGGSGVVNAITSGNGSIPTKNISTKMASGIRACKATGRSIMRMLSSSSSLSTTSSTHNSRRNSKTSCSVKCDEGQVHKEATYQRLNKVIMLGDSGVGKTSLLIMFRDGVYMPCYYVTTVGIDFMNKVVVVDGTRVKLQIWDTAGQERFRSVTHAYYRDAHALLLLYDVTNKTTYDNIRAWLCEIRDCAQEDVVIVLIGNKSDCSSSERQVKREDGERLAREHNVPFMETSAKTGLNVELAFQTVARQLKNRGYENGDDGKFNVHEFVRDNTKAKSICAQCSF
ncbi:Ras-related protein Rab-26 [Lucilia cuprina]|nr:Ras-related protein Rab-26 [Lucilia cuprina]